MPAAKKIRADAAEYKLPEAARAKLAALVAGNAPLKAIQSLFAGHGIELSQTGAARAHHRLAAAADRLLQKSAALKVLRENAAKQGITLTGAALEQAVLAVGDLLDASVDPTSEEGQQLLLKGLTGLTGARAVEVRATQGNRALDQTDRRLKLLEDRDAKTRAVVTDTKLTPAEKEAEFKRILGVG